MTSFCLLLLGALASFIISRMCKSASLYVFLVCVLLLGFVVGTGVKKVVANTSNTPSQELVVTMAPNPTSQGSTAFVGTVDNQSYEMGQEDGGETLVTTDREDTPTMSNNAEIEDDS